MGCLRGVNVKTDGFVNNFKVTDINKKKMDFAYSSRDPALFAGFNQSQQLINDS